MWEVLHREINLYLCERYGYRNACSVMWNENGICISVRFFKEYMHRYGYKHLCTEDDDYKYYQTLNLPCIKRGFMGYHCNYGVPLKDVDV
ncbi:MAG: hypothetical protein IJE52_00050 [Bacteroidales bacterium]|nr:hypothetical protein [Bacteroidales bacterium]